MGVDLDELDLRLLNELQKDNKIPMAELSQRVHSSPATCQRRIKRLREEGVIIADASVVDPVAIGLGMTLIVEVVIERERADLIDSFKRKVLECDQITHCYYVTGDADFVLLLHVSNIEEYDSIVTRIFHDNKNIKQFKTLVSIRRIKSTTKLPVAKFVHDG
jgi:Lrp/AsnC family transcriptional regulator, leucine-responsive regulatory protein